MIVPFIAITRSIIQNNYRPTSLQNKKQIQVFLKHPLVVEQFKSYSFRDFFSRVHNDFEKSLPGYKDKSSLVLFWTKHLPLISKMINSSSVNITKNCLKQVEFVIAQRIRRGQQFISLYTRLWDEKALRFLFQKMKHLLHKRGKQCLMGVSLLSFNWESERIPIEELTRHIDEINLCSTLREKVSARKKNDAKKTKTCSPPECLCPECDSTSDVYCWEPFISEEDLTVWKREENSHPGKGLYCYKMYGKYSDVTANDFLEVFLDTENRTKWDVHAATLKVIDSEPSSHSDVIYWETKWPTLFSNRDYVFKRRYYKDDQRNIIIIMNKSTEHPMYPPNYYKARVTEYWSYMVIKASTNFDEPGIEFSLTYFDNPGISLPSAISLWITIQGMPEYLKRLRIEALAINERRRHTKGETVEQITGDKRDKDQVDEKNKETAFTPKMKDTCSSDISSSGHPSDRDPSFPSYDVVFIFSSYMEKIKSTLWL